MTDVAQDEPVVKTPLNSKTMLLNAAIAGLYSAYLFQPGFTGFMEAIVGQHANQLFMAIAIGGNIITRVLTNEPIQMLPKSITDYLGRK